MKKTISISIASTLFYVEEDAYARLESYLAAIRIQFSDNLDGAEILADIEGRIAEKFSEANSKIVTLADVELVIKSMGEANELGSEETTTSRLRGAKKLYRDGDSKVIAGISGGLAHYFGIDASIVRIFFVLTLFFGGIGIIAYVLLWIVIPEATTPSQKLEMRGEPVTIAMMSSMIKDRINTLGTTEKAGRIAQLFNKLFKGIGIIFASIIPLIRIIAGTLLTFIGFVASLGITVGAGILLFNSSVIASWTGAMIHGPLAWILGIAIYIASIIPLLVVFFGGLTLLRKKNMLLRISSIPLLALWFLSLVAGGVAVSKVAINNASREETIRENIVLPLDIAEPFTAIDARDAVHAVIVPAKETSVAIEGTTQQINNTLVEVVDGVLVINRKERLPVCFFCFEGKPRVTITVATPLIERITASDASSVEGTGISAPALSIKASDASHVELTGTVGTLTIELSDASSYRGEGLSATDAVIFARDASSARVLVTKTLAATAQDASSIRYTGTPIVTKHTSDASSVTAEH